MILAYETSTNICSVAFQNAEGEVFEKLIQGRSVHSDNLFLFTQQLMKEHDFKIEDLNAVLDTDIIAAHWLSLEELKLKQDLMRSPLVLKCLEDYLAGQCFPLALIYES